jgi:sec-independent protein translocase protein TatA
MLSGWERPSHWLVLAVVVVVLFGYKKLPDASRAVGRSLRIFKTEIKGLSEDETARDAAAPTGEVPVAPVAQPAPVVQAAPVVQPAPVVQQAPVVQAAPVVAAAPVVQAAPIAPQPVPVAEAPVSQPLLMQQPAQLVDNPAPAVQSVGQPSNS